MVGARTFLALTTCLTATAVIFLAGHERTATGDDGDPRKVRPVNSATAPVNENNPEQVIAKLSNQELTTLARGGALPESWPADLAIRRDQLNEMLLQELARRWEKQESGSGDDETKEIDGVVESETPLTVGPAITNKDAAVDTPEEAVEVLVDSVTTKVISGDPMGVGRIELKFVKGHEPTIYPDQRLQLISANQSCHYATFNIDYADEGSDRGHRVERIEVLFLVRGNAESSLMLRGPNGELLRERITPAIDQTQGYQHLRSRWWQSFSEISKETSADATELKTAMLDMLARRHGFAIPIQTSKSNESEKLNTLEGQFERAIGMLFGIESVKLAMQDDVVLKNSTTRPVADRPIPNRRPMRSVQIPEFRRGWIEPIASRVPEECFYLRTGSLSNYLYFRGFLQGWGGALDDIVASRTLDRDLRQKIELQLGFDSAQISESAIDGLISDMALIGCDPLFQDGAAVGVLFEARDSAKLATEIKKHRRTIRASQEGVDERRLTDTRHPVSFLSTDDNRVRSFYAIAGSYHLVTNSRYLLDRFLQADQGERSLGNLKEFAYARSKVASKSDSIAFLYLSDPFFQLLVSPHYRVEMTRRAEAARELRQLRLADLIAQSERLPAQTITELKAARLLSNSFGLRPDHSIPQRNGGRYEDSIRGAEGVFLPVPDVPLEMVTAGESSAYARFLREYNRQWRRVDPVTVVLSKKPSPNNSSLQSLGLEILVTPYAQQRYATLNRHLADAPAQILQPGFSDLLSVQAAVRLHQGHPSQLLSMGLSDDDVDFVIENGAVRLKDERDGVTFAKSRAYVAITPPSTAMLKVLASTLTGKSSTPVQPRAPRRQSRSTTLPPPIFFPNAAPNVGRILYAFGWAFTQMPPEALQAAGYLSLIETRDEMTVVSMKERIRDQVFREVTKSHVHPRHKVRLSMRSLEGAKVEPYIQAFTYLEARRASSQNAQLLNDWTDWLQLAPGQARPTIERLLGGKIQCPLGGDYTKEGESMDWTGTTWSESSRYEITETPSSWEFPFLHWLQGLDLAFNIDPTTLHAEIGMVVRQPDEQQHLLVALRTDDPDWVLGIRVPRNQMPLRVSDVHIGSPAWRVGIRAGDEVASIDGQAPKSSAHLIELIATAQERGFAMIVLQRNGLRLERRVTLN